MIILSHRGYWLNAAEKNTLVAFKRSFELGFGTETDIRDYNGKLVISHDIPTNNKKHIEINEFFELYKSYNLNAPLALNIKSDGLQAELFKLIKDHDITNYFVFDMSVPDGLLYLKNMNVFTRQSEYETSPSFYSDAKGVWMDEFNNHWINKNTIYAHVSNKKSICIVSPELHNRPHLSEWNEYKNIMNDMEYNSMMICTDVPEAAKSFFNED